MVRTNRIDFWFSKKFPLMLGLDTCSDQDVASFSDQPSSLWTKFLAPVLVGSNSTSIVRSKGAMSMVNRLGISYAF